MNAPSPRYVYRSAINGKFVTREFAELNPSTTVRQIVPKPPKVGKS